LFLGINKGLAKGGTPALGVPALDHDTLCKKIKKNTGRYIDQLKEKKKKMKKKKI
jgi:hypothetical protein